MKTMPPLLAAVQPAASTLTSVDWLAIACYFGILLCVAWWVVRRAKDTAADYFLAGRNLGWWIIGASIFASNIGSEHIVGLAGTGATDGVALAHYELHAWCWPGYSFPFTPARWCSPCRNSSNVASRPIPAMSCRLSRLSPSSSRR